MQFQREARENKRGLWASKPAIQKSTAEKINLNTATASELEKLPGIGKVLSKRTVEFRQEHGNFHNLQDIIKVKGIGKKTFEKIKDNIRL